MKRLALFACTLIAIFVFDDSGAQNRQIGQSVEPLGWESQDSMRWGLYDFISPKEPDAYLAADTMGCNFDLFFGEPADTRWPTHKMRSGAVTAVYEIGNKFHNRIFYPSPLPVPVQFNNPTYWRYNDINVNSEDCHWVDSEYQINDISPYAEYGQDKILDNERFKPQESDSVAFKDAGRLILGYSEDNAAKNLMSAFESYPFRHWEAGWVAFNRTRTAVYDAWDTSLNRDSLQAMVRSWGNGHETDTVDFGIGPVHRSPKAFSAVLEFNTPYALQEWPDTSGGYGLDTNAVPILRLQILYKAKGQHLLPFVPFKRFFGDTNAGWHSLVDTLITRGSYNTLDPDWRVQDSVFDDGHGNPIATPHSARDWNFNQLRVMVRLPQDTMLPIATETQAFNGDTVIVANNFTDPHRLFLGRFCLIVDTASTAHTSAQ